MLSFAVGNVQSLAFLWKGISSTSCKSDYHRVLWMTCVCMLCAFLYKTGCLEFRMALGFLCGV